MKRTLTWLAVLVLSCPVLAEYSVQDKGVWPDNWPKELESLRKQSRTFEGPSFPQWHYLIPFTDRDDFEAAWPHILKVKTKGAPVILVRGPTRGILGVPAGVIVHSPYLHQSGDPIDGVDDVREKWTNTTYIELVVDGTTIDLNRIPLPEIVDERFKR